MATGADLIAVAQRELGKPYVFGAEGPGSFDCSGLVQYTLAQLGIKAPRLAHDQQNWAIPVTNPQPGDLVFWGRPAHHVGIYIGGGKMIDAPDVGQDVKVETVWGTPAGYGRVPGLAGGVVGSAINVGVQTVSATSGALAGLGRVGLTVLFAGAGVALLVAGAWVASSPGRARGRALVDGITDKIT